MSTRTDDPITYVLIPGAGGDPTYWHLVVPRLRALGHDVVAPDLKADDEAFGLADYVATVLEAIGDRRRLIVVGQSLGGFVAPTVCAWMRAELLVLVCPMIPAPGETPGAWWTASGQREAKRALDRREGRDPDAPFDLVELFFHDVPPDVLRQALEHGERDQADRPFGDPWPLDAWPDVPTRVLAGRHDRLFPLELIQRLARERVGVEADVIDSGHLPALACPDELVGRLERYRLEHVAPARAQPAAVNRTGSASTP